MSAIIDFNCLLFVILLVSNIVLCIKKVPMVGFIFGFLTIIITGTVFMNDIIINVYFSYFLIAIAFSCLLINGLDFRRKK
jgi:hypothetical protein